MYVNKTQSFGSVPPEVHEYQIGGYQVFDKWLNDSKKRRLDLDNIRTHCRMATSIRLISAIQQETDIGSTWRITAS